MSDYQLDVEGYSLSIGQKVEESEAWGATGAARVDNPTDWNIAPGSYSARQLVHELDALLQAMVVQMGDPAYADVLLDGLKAALALHGRESSLQIDGMVFGDYARNELKEQARAISGQIVEWARAAHESKAGIEQHGTDRLAEMFVRSRCERHHWLPSAAAAVTGPDGGPFAMQFNNEWLHQMILLRDALIPFENWQEVPVPVLDTTAGKGLRHLERAREKFLTDWLIKQVRHDSIVSYAQSVFQGDVASPVGYGFQTHLGLVFPSVVGGSLEDSSRNLLRFHPARLIEVDQGETISFVYEYDDYYSVARTQIDGLNHAFAGSDLDDLASAELAVTSQNSSSATINLRLTTAEGGVYEVDLGQMTRGHRFSYIIDPAKNTDPAQRQLDMSMAKYEAWSVLDLPGLVTSGAGVHVLEVENPILRFALLGKIYPENTVLQHAGEIDAALGTGKGFGAKFILTSEPIAA